MYLSSLVVLIGGLLLAGALANAGLLKPVTVALLLFLACWFDFPPVVPVAFATEKHLFLRTLFGVRRYPAQRSKLRRELIEVETPWGPVKAKRGWRDDGFEVVTPEYEDCARLARELGIPLRDVYAAVRR